MCEAEIYCRKAGLQGNLKDLTGEMCYTKWRSYYIIWQVKTQALVLGSTLQPFRMGQNTLFFSFKQLKEQRLVAMKYLL